MFLSHGLESAMAELGGSIDKFEVDILLRSAGGLVEQCFSQGDDTFLRTDDGSLDHNPVFADSTIMGEST